MHTFWLILHEERFLNVIPKQMCFHFCKTSTNLWHYRTVHLHSIIIEIAHQHLLNTEHKERNVWKHFNLREAKEEQGIGVGGKLGNVVIWLSDRWLQTNQGRRRVLCRRSWSWSWAGFFGIFWAVCTTCRTTPEPVPTEKHDGRSSLTQCRRCLLLV